MDKFLLKAINRSAHLGFQKENMIGLIVMLILSRDVFNKNLDVANFIESIFGVKFPNYAMRSRTLMIAKLVRYINLLDEGDIEKSYKKLSTGLVEIRDNAYDEVKTIKEKNKNNNAFSNMHKWIAGTGKKE